MSEIPASSLLTGIGVVIDDHVHTARTQQKPAAEQDPIADLLKQIDEAGIPVVPYESLPKPEACLHFGHIAFVLLDWELWKKPAEQLALTGVTVGPEFEERGIQENIAFLKALRNCCFAPVFIFTYLESDGIAEILRREKLFGDSEARNFILIRKKDDLKRTEERKGTLLLDAVNKWIASNPSIYVLTHWNAEVARSQNRLFWDFYDKDHTWPSVLWQVYDADHDSPEHALADVLLRNMRARMSPLSLNREHVAPESLPEASIQTLRAVLEACVMVSAENNRLPANQYGCGDIFKAEDDRGHTSYRLNIRCDCDCISRDGNPDNTLLYLLNGQIVPERQLARDDVFSDRTGFARDMNKSYIFPIDGGKCVAFRFKDLEQKTIANLSQEGARRIGRLTAPHITDIRQRYSQWLQREGFPKIPALAVRAVHNER